MNHLLHSTDLFECYCWQKYTTINNTDLYLSYFNLSYVFIGHNDSIEQGLTVPKYKSTCKETMIKGCEICRKKESVQIQEMLADFNEEELQKFIQEEMQET